MPTVAVTVQINSIGTDAGPFTISDNVLGSLATGVTRLQLLGGFVVNADDTATTITVTSNEPCSTVLAIPIFSSPCGGPTPPPPANVCYTVSTGLYPVSGGAGSNSTGTITVTGTSVNVWAKYNSAGSSSGTAIYSMTINSINADGSDTITGSGQTFYSSNNGSTGFGFITLAPGTYNYTLTKTDNLTSGNSVRFSWSAASNPALSAEMSGCIAPPPPTPTPTPPPSPTPPPPPPPSSSSWIIRNANCGFGTINDIGINGSFMNSLEGPSDFPLTSTLYGTKTNPSGINYGGLNTIQCNVTTNIAGSGNCGAIFVYINGVVAYDTYFTTTPFPSISNVFIQAGDLVEVQVACYTGPCP